MINLDSPRSLPLQPQETPDGDLQGHAKLYAEEDGERSYFHLPNLTIEIEATNPEQQAALGRLFSAIGAAGRNRPRPSYEHGYVGPYDTFTILKD